MIDDPYRRDQSGPDALEEGYWLIQRRRAGRVDMPLRIWFGPPTDPETGCELDRSWRWQIEICGHPFDGQPLRIGGITFEHLSDFWPAARGGPIGRDDYQYRVDHQAWAAVHDPADPRGTPGGKIDPMSATLPFMENE